jgi:hypothetical protein
VCERERERERGYVYICLSICLSVCVRACKGDAPFLLHEPGGRPGALRDQKFANRCALLVA